jgi:hypothetical protein
VVTSCFARFMFKEILLLSTDCISAIFMDIRTKGDYLVFRYRNVGACSLHGLQVSGLKLVRPVVSRTQQINKGNFRQ